MKGQYYKYSSGFLSFIRKKHSDLEKKCRKTFCMACNFFQKCYHSRKLFEFLENCK
ncbi:hypothetical protein HMPREF8573_1438 [Streptococcus sanguinis ATCC 29667]|nr:hypothetical protein HMPREF8573_1438 [Streptococcus sanguinis ATCC 29667]